MDRQYYDEMITSLNFLEQEQNLRKKRIYLFGHCDASENLVNVLLDRGYVPIAILDNNVSKYGNRYRGVIIEPPGKILEDEQEQTLVCIAARAYAAMSAQLKCLGYKGQICRLVDYNTYADYSLSDETIVRMRKREQEGEILLNILKEKYPDTFILLCPFCALGDIYIMMSYLPVFLSKRGIKKCVIGVIGNICAQVVKLYGGYNVESFVQKDMDKTIQAALYTKDKNVFIPHQDRPYVVDLFKALYIKKIPLEQIYCCGVFGLPKETDPISPTEFREYEKIESIPKGNAVVFSPYAKSVTALPEKVWKDIVLYYKNLGKVCYTNVVEDEQPLEGTIGITPEMNELRSVVERAGCFVGIRSGICDVLKTANAVRIALFPDYNYCDTQWKAFDMYFIDGWKNVVVHDGFKWEDVI